MGYIRERNKMVVLNIPSPRCKCLLVSIRFLFLWCETHACACLLVLGGIHCHTDPDSEEILWLSFHDA